RYPARISHGERVRAALHRRLFTLHFVHGCLARSADDYRSRGNSRDQFFSATRNALKAAAVINRRDCLKLAGLACAPLRLPAATKQEFPTSVAQRVARAFRTPG